LRSSPERNLVEPVASFWIKGRSPRMTTSGTFVRTVDSTLKSSLVLKSGTISTFCRSTETYPRSETRTEYRPAGTFKIK